MLGLTTGGIFVSYFTLIVAISMKNPSNTNVYNEWQVIEFLSRFPAEGGPFFYYTGVTVAVLTLIPAFAGLVACLLETRERHVHDAVN